MPPLRHVLRELREVPSLGKHLICEYYGCSFDLLNQVEGIQGFMHDAALFAGATIVDERFHSFEPHGVSGVVVIAESHLTVHTWPEYGYAAVDVFTCGDQIEPRDAADFLNKVLGAERYTVEVLTRGIFDASEFADLPHKPSIQ
jgi:S-adenosylmethionine decarboxylase